MRTVNDIAADVASGDTETIKADFRSLVAWPDIVTIEPPSPDVLTYLLEHLAQALRGDMAPMPADLVEHLALACPGAVPMTGTDFSAGAALVLANLDHWRERYANPVPEGVGVS